MPCTGAGLAGVFKWNINRSGPVMATVIRLKDCDRRGTPKARFKPMTKLRRFYHASIHVYSKSETASFTHTYRTWQMRFV